MCLFLFYDVWDSVPQILKARIGETGPLLFKLPQLLSQLFHRLLGAPFPSYAFALCQSGEDPLEHELTSETIGRALNHEGF
jgi:hypothetical protein